MQESTVNAIYWVLITLAFAGIVTGTVLDIKETNNRKNVEKQFSK